LYSLSYAYPNPSTQQQQFHIPLPSASNVKLIVFNTLDRMQTLVSEYKNAGNYIINLMPPLFPTVSISTNWKPHNSPNKENDPSKINMVHKLSPMLYPLILNPNIL